MLQNDIVLSMTGELSIPTFAGIFDGSGFTISNVKLTGDGSAVGLFRYVQEGAKVRNLTVTGEVSPSGSQDQVGGIVGVNYGSIEIVNLPEMWSVIRMSAVLPESMPRAERSVGVNPPEM